MTVPITFTPTSSALTSARPHRATVQADRSASRLSGSGQASGAFITRRADRAQPGRRRRRRPARHRLHHLPQRGQPRAHRWAREPTVGAVHDQRPPRARGHPRAPAGGHGHRHLHAERRRCLHRRRRAHDVRRRHRGAHLGHGHHRSPHGVELPWIVYGDVTVGSSRSLAPHRQQRRRRTARAHQVEAADRRDVRPRPRGIAEGTTIPAGGRRHRESSASRQPRPVAASATWEITGTDGRDPTSWTSRASGGRRHRPAHQVSEVGS